MYKISRVYVGNCGVRLSWYDGLILDFRSVDSKQPTDTIIHLENGGGKSILLSFIFSCFETRMDRFLKHLHDSKNRMSQYFSEDGLPGFIAVEWYRDDGPAAEARVVTAQVVANKAVPGASELERHYFSYIVTNDITLESIPGPKLNGNSARQMSEVLRWIDEQKRLKRGRFFSTRMQNDWERHLEFERGLDIGLLKLQLEFSRVEGGVDSGFLTFKSELDFLKLFFELTLDQDRIRNVRDALSLTCDKLRRKPEFEARAAGLTDLLGAALEFSDQAQSHEQAQASWRALTGELGLAFNSFTSLRGEVVAIEESLSAQVQLLNGKKTELLTQEADLKKRIDVNQLLQHSKVFEDCNLTFEASEESVSASKFELDRLKAGQLARELSEFESTVEALRAKRHAAEAGLEEVREPLRLEGSLLRLRYQETHDSLNSRIDELQSAGTESVRERIHFEKRSEELQQEVSRLQRLQGERLARLVAYKNALACLVKDAVILPDEEPDLAFRRYSEQLDGNRIKISELEQYVTSTSQTLEILKTRLESCEEERRDKCASKDEILRELARAENLADEIKNLNCVSALSVDFAVAEESPSLLPGAALLEELRHFRSELTAKQDRSSVALFQLRVDRESIAACGLTRPSDDVEKVVEFLKSSGIKTARSFAGYLAQIVPNAAEARRIVVSDPSRFLGVCVQTEKELVACSQLKALQLELKNSVVVSLVEDKPTVGNYSVVFSASRDCHFNLEAAAIFAEELSEQEQSLIEFSASVSAEIDDCHGALAKVEYYLKNYPADKLIEFHTEQARLSRLILDLEEEFGKLRLQIENCEGEMVRYQGELADAKERKQELTAGLVQVKQFLNGFEQSLAALQLSLSEVEAELDDTTVLLTDCRAAISRIIQDAIEKAILLEKLKHESLAFGKKRSEVDYFLSESEFANVLEGSREDLRCKELFKSTLETLENTYRRSRALLDRSSNEKLAVLDIQIAETENSIDRAAQRFRLEFPAFAPSQLKELFELDLVEAIIVAKAELASVLASRDQAGSARARAEALFEQFRLASGLSLDELAGLPEPLHSLSAQEIHKLNSELEIELGSLCASVLAVESNLNEISSELLSARENLEKVEKTLIYLSSQEFASHAEIDRERYSLESMSEILPVLQETGKKAKAERARISELFTALTRQLVAVKERAGSEDLRKYEPVVAESITRAELDAAILSATSWAEDINERLRVTQDILSNMKGEFASSVEELLVLLEQAVRILHSAANNKKVPASAPYVGNKAVLKYRSTALAGGVDSKRGAVETYLDRLIAESRPPGAGAALLADLVLLVAGGQLHLQFLKMVIDPQEQYVPINKLTNSGGEAVAMAMFLYLVTAQIRAEQRFSQKSASSGPLILDNPFAKATNPGIWQAQRALAQAMGTQLILATAMPDYNTLGEFARIVRLRRVGQNNKSGRWHLELCDYEFFDRN